MAATRIEGGVAVASVLLLADDGASYERVGVHAIRDLSVLTGLGARSDGRLHRSPTVSTRALAGT